MGDRVNVGVDLGSMGLRVAFFDGKGTPKMLEEALDERVPWLLCEPSSASNLGLAFPSLKSKLGVATKVLVGRDSRDPADMVRGALRTVREAVCQQSTLSIDQAVVSVPARYSASQRAALRSVGIEAGFSDVHLVNDSIAAVIAYTSGSEKPTTVLVYSAGYSGFEVGLVRAVRGHYRALGYEGGATPAGSTLDLVLLEAVFNAVSQKDLVIDTHGWDRAMWMQMRAEAARVKEGVGTEEHVSFPVVIRTPDGRIGVRITFSRSNFDEVVTRAYGMTVTCAQGLISQAGMSSSDVDAVLLVGGITRIPVLQALLEKGLGLATVAMQREDLALGAALHAAWLEPRKAVVADLEQPTKTLAESPNDSPRPSVRVDIEVTDGKTGRAGDEPVVLARPTGEESSVPGREDPIAQAKRLVEQGRGSDARALLDALVAEVQTFLRTIPVEAPVSPTVALAEPAAPASSLAPQPISFLAHRALARAEHLLVSGQYEEAVRASHLAWQESSESPDIFEKMLDIHCRAAADAADPACYADAQRWLLCANSHNESNTRVRQLLAERHYSQAKHLLDRGKRKEALETLERCFQWAPEHTGARQLQQMIARR